MGVGIGYTPSLLAPGPDGRRFFPPFPPVHPVHPVLKFLLSGATLAALADRMNRMDETSGRRVRASPGPTRCEEGEMPHNFHPLFSGPAARSLEPST
jgi:hypothetical protein